MSTLYDKLKPEYKQSLNEQEELYPTLVKSVKSALKNTYLWSHLSIGQARELVSFTRLIYDMYYNDEITQDVAAKLLNKLEQLSNKKKRW